MTAPALSWTVVTSPIGPLRLSATGDRLGRIEFEPHGPELPASHRDDDAPVLAAAATQLAEYFAGERRTFALSLDPGGSDFQQRVWQQLQRIGYGETASYGEIAARLGMTNAASRAVGLANGRNPIPIVVPCHRVIGADGSLTGYAGGLERKRTLLALEQRAGALF